MSFLSSILPALGAIGGSLIPGLGTGIGAAIGGALGSGIGGSLASNDAASAQSNAAQQAQNTQLDMFNKQQANLAPWLQSGQNAQTALMQYLGIGPGGSFNPSAPGVAPFDPSMLSSQPGYQFGLREGQNALLHNQSALGGLGGGNTMKALDRYSQNYANTNYQQALQNYLTQQQNTRGALGGVANTGVNAAGGIAQLGSNAANNISSLQAAQGQYNAAGILGGQNAGINATNSGLANWLQALSLQGGGGPVNSFAPMLNNALIPNMNSNFTPIEPATSFPLG